jgi:hypothetical protein
MLKQGKSKHVRPAEAADYLAFRLAVNTPPGVSSAIALAG